MKTFAKVLVLALIVGLTTQPISSQEKEERKVERANSEVWAVELLDHFITAVNASKYNEARRLCTDSLNERWEQPEFFVDFFGKEVNSQEPIPEDHQFTKWTRGKEVISPDKHSLRLTGTIQSSHRKLEYKVMMVKEDDSPNRWRIDSVLLKPVK